MNAFEGILEFLSDTKELGYKLECHGEKENLVIL